MNQGRIWSILVALTKIPMGLIKLPYTLITAILLIRAPNWRFPPGPLANCLPFFGSLPLFAFGPSYLMLARMAEKLGKIYRLKLGSTTFIVISDPALLLETFSNVDVSGRSVPPLMDVMDRLGIFHADGDLARSQRAFIASILQNLHDPKHPMSKAYLERASISIGALVEELEAADGRPLAIETALSFAITNILFSVLVGTVFFRDDRDLLKLIDSTHESFRTTHLICFANFMPCIARLPGPRRALRECLNRKAAFVDYMRAIVERHQQELDPENPRDLIDAFLVEMTRPYSQDRYHFIEPQLYAILSDIFSVNLTTMSATIQWLLLAVLKYPHIQIKIRNEIRKVVRDDEAPTWNKLRLMPCLEVTVREGLRFSSILPLGVPHRTVRDTVVEGYSIPAGATVVGLFWNLHRNPSIWTFKPNTFNRYNQLSCRSQFAFSAGTRSCLGKDVSQSMIYLILSALLQKFRIEPDDQTKLPSLDDSRFGILRETLPFKAKFIRHQLF